MEFFDDAVSKAKEAIDVACKKTNEVVTLQKQKFNVAALESRRAKDFQLLGEIIYNKIKDDETEDGNIANLVASIKEKDEKIAELRGIINNAKNKRVCPECSAIIDRNSNYCNVCGADLNAVKSEEEKPENGAEGSTEE